MRKYIFVLFFAALPIIFLSCTVDLPDNLNSFLLFDGVTFDAETETLDFGIVMTGTDNTEISGTVSNFSSDEITVTALSIDDSNNYKLMPFELPKVMAAGAEADFSLIFTPESSGTKNAVVSITFNTDEEATVNVNVTGMGNNAPEASFGIDVSGSVQYSEINGFYERDGNYNSAAKYKKSGSTDYYIYLFNPEVEMWGIDDTTNTAYPEYVDGTRFGPRAFIGFLFNTEQSYFPPETVMSDELEWTENYTGYPSITVKTGITLVGDYLKSNHKYIDNEGDAEDGTTYRWYESYTVDGTYSEISGSTLSSILITGREGSFIKLEVTPVDVNGFAGTPVESDPYWIEPEEIMVN
ncbi:MAG: hypothetical protein PQJ61_13065 [Spirochaetales bacterium]|uniref:Abnormal spindle-like microcephaly-associated protein ASH domain-containing protein n=1 Tax=Candidatus Thalassospirochaeta sargassi TaxID=3119039 RepID=A0AAJ1MPE7_9SPIO|nr:hypothetical protein [Spirochaetales bacterium]